VLFWVFALWEVHTYEGSLFVAVPFYPIFGPRFYDSKVDRENYVEYFLFSILLIPSVCPPFLSQGPPSSLIAELPHRSYAYENLIFSPLSPLFELFLFRSPSLGFWHAHAVLCPSFPQNHSQRAPYLRTRSGTAVMDLSPPSSRPSAGIPSTVPRLWSVPAEPGHNPLGGSHLTSTKICNLSSSSIILSGFSER